MTTETKPTDIQKATRDEFMNSHAHWNVEWKEEFKNGVYNIEWRYKDDSGTDGRVAVTSTGLLNF